MQTLLERALRYWMGKPESSPELVASHAQFHLIYQGLLVGVLSVSDGHWTFCYSDEFRRQQKLRPIVEFPDLNKTYTSDELWPFFGMRIPSLKQTSIHDIVVEEKIDEADEAQLLRRFGKRTIANPFELVEQA